MRHTVKVIALLIVLGFSIQSEALAIEKGKFSTKPCTNNGQKWRIAYYEGGYYDNYYYYLVATVEGLMQLGWVKKIPLPGDSQHRTDKLWQWLANSNISRYIEFVKDAYYTDKWDESVRRINKKTLIKRLNQKRDIDLIFAMGTWAGIDLATNEHKTPTIVMSTSDPIKSGIIRSIEDSGLDHVHARVDPSRYERQVRIFHDLIGFKKLGVAYENTVYGKTYAAIDLIEKVAREKDFEVVSCYTKSDISDQEMAGASVIKCFNTLAKEVDAIYVTQQGGVNNSSIPELVQISFKNQLPTFSQLGSEEVKKGFLLSISRAAYKYVGKFHAATIAAVFNGAKPRQLSQEFEEPPKFAINLKTAEEIGVYLYADLLAAADEIYTNIH
jgi:ABC-type uncharacterized transport system substrate-binding protein